MAEEGRIISGNGTLVSIIIPTYNELRNILKVLKSIGEILPKNILTEAIVFAVMTAAFSNFVLNKKFTFKEKLWG